MHLSKQELGPLPKRQTPTALLLQTFGAYTEVGKMKKIELVGKYSDLEAIVDDEDYEGLLWYRWYGCKCGHRIEPRTRLFGGGQITMARFLMNVSYDLPDTVVDHINHNALDNRKCNLRVCTYSQNAANNYKCRGRGSSKYIGVTQNKKNGKWKAQCVGVSAGSFVSEIAAALARDRLAKELQGEFAMLNFKG